MRSGWLSILFRKGFNMSTVALFGLPREVEVRWLGETRSAMFTRSVDTVAEAVQEFPASAYIVINEMPEGTAAKPECRWT